MELVPAGVPLSFEITYDAPDLYVGMDVYDMSGDSPVKVGSTIPMDNVAQNTYSGKFTADHGKDYVAIKSVYTDAELTTLDESGDYASGSESFRAEYSSQSCGCDVIGFVFDNNPIIGLINC
jgi:hypothetical protein